MPTIPEPTLPAMPPPPAGAVSGHVYGNLDLIHPGDFVGGAATDPSPTSVDLDGANGASAQLGGTNFTYDFVSGTFAGGTVDAVTYFVSSGGVQTLNFSIFPVSIPATAFNTWALANDAQGALSTILGGPNNLMGQAPVAFSTITGADLIRGYGGDDSIDGFGGPDTIYGGDGNDVITTARGVSQTYLRGDAGDDYIVGGGGFDDINGNQGNDTISGSDGDDWVVGGKDNDLQFGGNGDDIVWGNLGNDTLEGGAGNDQVRGGQGDDILFGDAGNDYISGDRGNDTEMGGAGADIFHSFSGAGIDRVLDFSAAEGDRVMLDPGTTYTVSQVGADTVVDMGNGDQLILVGVTLSSLPAGWIFLG